jgi:hypothetical protein
MFIIKVIIITWKYLDIFILSWVREKDDLLQNSFSFLILSKKVNLIKKQFAQMIKCNIS